MMAVGHVISILRLNVPGHSVWCEIERLSHVFSIHHIFKCADLASLSPPNISRPLIVNTVTFCRACPQASLAERCFDVTGVNGGYISLRFFLYLLESNTTNVKEFENFSVLNF